MVLQQIAQQSAEKAKPRRRFRTDNPSATVDLFGLQAGPLGNHAIIDKPANASEISIGSTRRPGLTATMDIGAVASAGMIPLGWLRKGREFRGRAPKGIAAGITRKSLKKVSRRC